MLTEIQFTSSTIGGGVPARRRAWTFPRRYQVQVSADGNTWSAAVAEGQGAPGTPSITFAPIEREVRSDHADCDRRRRAAVVDAAASPLCGVQSDGAIAVLVMTPPCVRHRRIRRLIVARSTARRGDRAQLLLRARFESAAELISERPDFRVGRIGRLRLFLRNPRPRPPSPRRRAY